MLTDHNHAITTGSRDDIKTLAAWTCFRNAFFLTYIGAYAEKFIVSGDYDYVYFTGGFMNLTESGVYPDNSERFINAFSQLTEFGSICGKRIIPLNGLCNLLKSEQYVLLNEFGFLKLLFPYLVSCDRPIVITDEKVSKLFPANCCTRNKRTGKIEPACGSGRLAWWAASMAGFKDNRTFYNVNDDCELMEKDVSNIISYSVCDIIDKLVLPEKSLDKLRSIIERKNKNVRGR